MEEVVARNYLIEERPDVILNIVDGTNLERNLYLSTQMTEIGIPVVIAINMMDVVRKNGDTIDLEGLSKAMGCPVVEVSALKGDGVDEVAEIAVKTAKEGKTVPHHHFSGEVEHAIAHIEEAVVHHLPEEQQRWYAIKLFERDSKVMEQLGVTGEVLAHIEKDIVEAERELDDDAEAIIINERYLYVEKLLKGVYVRKNAGKATVSEKIDRVLTNRFAALPIFMAIMFLVYYISVTTVGTWVTDFTNDGLFGDGFFLLGITNHDELVEEYVAEHHVIEQAYEILEANSGTEIRGYDEMLTAATEGDFAALEETIGSYGSQITVTVDENGDAVTLDGWLEAAMAEAPAPDDEQVTGVWIPGVPVLFEDLLDAMNVQEGNWVRSLVIDGIVLLQGKIILPALAVLLLAVGLTAAGVAAAEAVIERPAKKCCARIVGYRRM